MVAGKGGGVEIKNELCCKHEATYRTRCWVPGSFEISVMCHVLITYGHSQKHDDICIGGFENA